MSKARANIITSSPEETRAIGVAIGEKAVPGTVIGLYGDLGSGKTCLVQGIAEGLGVPPASHVSSPTFVIINEYRGRIPLFHLDLYRVTDVRDLYELGWEDYLDRGGVIAVEWAERMGSLIPRDHLHITLEIAGEQSRRIVLAGKDAAGLEHALAAVKKKRVRFLNENPRN